MYNEKIQTNRKRKCRCRMETHTQSMGGGSFTMFQRQVCDDCFEFDFKHATEELEITLGSSLRKGVRIGSFEGLGEAHQEFETGDLEFIISNIS